MYKEWESFRITLVLYGIIFILPFTFYFVQNSFETMREDTKTVRQTTWMEAAVQSIALTPGINETSLVVSKIDHKLQQTDVWIKKINTQLFT